MKSRARGGVDRGGVVRGLSIRSHSNLEVVEVVEESVQIEDTGAGGADTKSDARGSRR